MKVNTFKEGMSKARRIVVDLSKGEVTDSYIKPKKSLPLAFIFWLFGGIFGAHRYYLGDYVMGILFTLTFGGLGIAAVLDLFSLKQRVDEINASAALTEQAVSVAIRDTDEHTNY